MVKHPFDIAPEGGDQPARSVEAPRRESTAPGFRTRHSSTEVPEVPTDVQTSALMESHRRTAGSSTPRKDEAVQTASWTQTQPGTGGSGANQRTTDLRIPPQFPGSEAPALKISKDPAAWAPSIDRIYPELPPLPVEPTVQPGPEGRPYTLAEFQRLAAANSPTLRQAASDVEAAKGNLIQAKTYPNPVLSYLVDPSNNNSTAGVQGAAIEQVIRTGGKQRLGVAAAQKDLDNAVLALKRARSDLSTAVRNAYFTLLVDVETLIVTRAVAQFADDVYRIQTGIVRGTQAAPYEPASLRAQVYLSRLAYKQAIYSYIYDWKSLVASIGLHQLPLSEIAGRVDRFIPYYDYDTVLAHSLQNHTDILTARNGVVRAQYVLKLAQVTPKIPDLDVRGTLEKDFALAPFGTYHALSVGFPIPIWDQNKGTIIAAQAALVRASEESHRVEVTLANNLAAAYTNYKNNLAALEDYRRNILPDLVRYYRGVFARRQIDQTSAFGDLVNAQQILSTNVTAYVGILGNLWSSIVNVADFLQTDDLYQLAEPRELPELPDFNQLSLLTCGHSRLAEACASRSGVADPHSLSALPARPLAGHAESQPAHSGTPGQSSEAEPGIAPRSRSPGEAAPALSQPGQEPAPPVTSNPFGGALDRGLDPRKLLETWPTQSRVLESKPDLGLDLQVAPNTGQAAR
jgi:cobalt-zinc-cadmium efflux system outer membrane protein